MSLNDTPSANRTHIGIFGRRNAGKSSVINALTGQSLAIVSEIKGTTTDPVLKAMELLPLGPVVMIDTPGLDDEGELGQLRIQKAYQILNKTDIAILVVDGLVGLTTDDTQILEHIKKKQIPYLIVMNKMDLLSQITDRSAVSSNQLLESSEPYIWVSTTTGANIQELKELIAKQVLPDHSKYPIVKDLLKPADFVILVIPID
ncbi:MAG: GTP-binding protein, partial [Lachnospiraceae bacterium]